MVVSEISERAVLSLEAPIGRICSRYNLPIRQAENIWLPNAKDIEAKLEKSSNFNSYSK